MAPIGLREKIYELVDNEIRIVKEGGEGHIIAKMNSLLDQPVIQKLYEASMAGVEIELIVRGICTLRQYYRAQYCGAAAGAQPYLLVRQQRRRAALHEQRRLDAP